MNPRFEIPFPPKPAPPQGGRLAPPLVPVEPRWEYRDVTRDLDAEGLPSEAELNALGAEHWELVDTVADGRTVHFYFKRAKHG